MRRRGSGRARVEGVRHGLSGRQGKGGGRVPGREGEAKTQKKERVKGAAGGNLARNKQKKWGHKKKNGHMVK